MSKPLFKIKKPDFLIYLAASVYILYPNISPIWLSGTEVSSLFLELLPIDCFLTLFVFYLFCFGARLIIRRKAVLAGAIAFFAGIPVIWVLKIIIYYFYDTMILGILIPGSFPYFPKSIILLELHATIVVSIYGILFRLLLEWVQLQKNQAVLISQNLLNELAILRYQINPHFFFNTLNNIYFLTEKRPQEAQSAIMKLSVIMRYLLYESSSETVLLSKELEHLINYIELEKLRIPGNDFVDFRVEGFPGNHRIAPLLLFPLIENAFKHCEREAGGTGITILLRITDNALVLQVTNLISAQSREKKRSIGGVGLNNVRRRLELLYKDHYEFRITEDNHYYNLFLRIEIE